MPKGIDTRIGFSYNRNTNIVGNVCSRRSNGKFPKKTCFLRTFGFFPNLNKNTSYSNLFLENNFGLSGETEQRKSRPRRSCTGHCSKRHLGKFVIVKAAAATVSFSSTLTPLRRGSVFPDRPKFHRVDRAVNNRPADSTVHHCRGGYHPPVVAPLIRM